MDKLFSFCATFFSVCFRQTKSSSTVFYEGIRMTYLASEKTDSNKLTLTSMMLQYEGPKSKILITDSGKIEFED